MLIVNNVFLYQIGCINSILFTNYSFGIITFFNKDKAVIGRGRYTLVETRGNGIS